MKNSIKLLFSAVIAVMLVTSCSKEDENDVPDYSEKNVSIVLSYGGDYEAFDEILGIQITGSDVSNTDVEGVNWDEEMRTDKLAAQFTRTGDINGSAMLRTSKPISSCTLMASFMPKDNQEDLDPVTVNIQYYIEDELVDSENYVFKNNTDSYQKVFLVQDHLDKL